ncbi:stalled ribosome rescue protein Dom34 [Bradyrhizobium embrapense]
MNEMALQSHAHAVVWIDHLVAKVFGVGLTGISTTAVHAHLASQHLHHRANTIGDGRVQADATFLARVGEAVSDCSDLLVIGPGIEKVELTQYLRAERPDLNLHVESSDHPTDAEIVALGRKRFHLGDER